MGARDDSASSGGRLARSGPLWNARRGLVVHAVEALDDGLLQLVDHLGPLAGHRDDPVDALEMNLYLEPLGPAATTAQPGPDRRLLQWGRHRSIYVPVGAVPLPRRPRRRYPRAAATGGRPPSSRRLGMMVSDFGRAQRPEGNYKTRCDLILAPEAGRGRDLGRAVRARRGAQARARGMSMMLRLTIGNARIDGDNATAEIRISRRRARKLLKDMLELL